MKKGSIKVLTLLLAIVMIGYGIYRKEVDKVLGKAIKICLECVGIG